MTFRIRDAILIVVVVGALLVTGWTFYGLGRRLPAPPPVHDGPVPERNTPYENAGNLLGFTVRSPGGHPGFAVYG